jgi:hypothetical protein
MEEMALEDGLVPLDSLVLLDEKVDKETLDLLDHQDVLEQRELMVEAVELVPLDAKETLAQVDHEVLTGHQGVLAARVSYYIMYLNSVCERRSFTCSYHADF